jgi:hypothetical protein
MRSLLAAVPSYPKGCNEIVARMKELQATVAELSTSSIWSPKHSNPWGMGNEEMFNGQ